MSDLPATILQLGPFALTWQGAFLACGLLLGVSVCRRLLGQARLDPALATDLALWVIPAGIIGSRLLHVFNAWNYYAVHPLEILAIERGGASAYGAILFGTVAALLFVRRRRLPTGPFFDATGPAQALGLAVGRLGDLVDEWLTHRLAHLTPAVPGPGATPADLVHPLFPLAAAGEAGWDLVLFLILLKGRTRRLPAGVTFWGFTGLYALGRIWTGFVRGAPPDVGPFSQDQVIAMGMVAASLGALIVIAARELRRHNTTSLHSTP